MLSRSFLSLGWLLIAAGAAAADPTSTLPAGSLDFAGRLARDHWHLFGEEKRAELEMLNRELREASHLLDTATDPGARTAEEERARNAATRMRNLVTSHPRRVRVDLTAPRPRLELDRPIEQPGRSGALLFEVNAGGEGRQFSVTTRDLAELPRGTNATLVIVEVGATGVTHAVAGLENLPVGRTTLMVEFRRAGRGNVRLPLDVVTPGPGRLKLTVLSDDTGEPVPAMVRLTWKTDGRARPPSNAIDFAPQFDSNGKVTAERVAYLPGTRKGSFWCAPEPFDMTLSPGRWEIAVGRGFEHTPVFEEITIRPGETLEKTIRPKRWVTMRESGWWSGDDHVHARLTSDRDARNILAWAQAEDVHVTNVLHMGDLLRTYFEQRGFGPEHRVQAGDYVLVPAQECPRTGQIGHVLTMNTRGVVRDPSRYFLYDIVLDGVHAAGGLTGYAHASSGMFEVHRDMTLNVPRQKIDFFEIHQFNNLGTDLYYEFLNLGCKVTASAGSDLPWGGTIGETRIYAHLGSQPFSADAWFEAVRRGRTFVTSGPMIELTVDNALPGDELRVEAGRALRVRARAWDDRASGQPVRLEIVRHGEVIRAIESGAGRAEAELDFTLDAADGFWIAARARTGIGTSAHTTPVYVVRDGMRFWNHAGLDALFAKREASLAQIEEIVAEATQAEAEGRLRSDPYRRQLAADGPQLLERVAAAWQLFGELRNTAEAERPRRGVDPHAKQQRSDPPGWELIAEQNFPLANEYSRWRVDGPAEVTTTMERTLQVRTKRGYMGAAATSESTIWFDQPAPADVRIEFDASAERESAVELLLHARSGTNQQRARYGVEILRSGQQHVVLRRLDNGEEIAALARAPSPFGDPERVHHFDVRLVGPRIEVIVDGKTLFDVADEAARREPGDQVFIGFRNRRPGAMAFDNVRVYRRADESRPVVWRIDGLSVHGAPKPTVLGAPERIAESGRVALRFDGVDDGLIFPVNPIQGQRAFTIEVLFKPDGDGPAAQRFVHVEDTAENRALIETRVTPDRQWYLDTFLYAKPTDTGVTLVDRAKLHPCDRWYWAALVYGGRTMTHFVDARKEKDGTIAYGPMVEGRTSVGVRLNQVFWFKGAIAEVRFHPRALTATELQRLR